MWLQGNGITSSRLLQLVLKAQNRKERGKLLGGLCKEVSVFEQALDFYIDEAGIDLGIDASPCRCVSSPDSVICIPVARS